MSKPVTEDRLSADECQKLRMAFHQHGLECIEETFISKGIKLSRIVNEKWSATKLDDLGCTTEMSAWLVPAIKQMFDGMVIDLHQAMSHCKISK